jgi:ribosomal protein S17E
MSVLLAKQIDVSKIKYSEVKILKSAAKSVYVNYNGSKLFMQTPVMSLPYGVNDNSKFSDQGDEKKYDLTLSFGGMQENAKVKQFFDKLKEFEEKIIGDSFDNRMSWFKNNFNNNKDVVSTMFTPMIKHHKNKETGDIDDKYPPSMKVKIPYNSKEDKFEFDAYDMDNNEVGFASILDNLKGGKAQLIIQLNGIWFAGGMFGASWKVVSGKFQQNNVSKITFLVDSDAEDNDDEDDDISIDEDVLKKQLPVPSKSQKTEKAATPVVPVVPATPVAPATLAHPKEAPKEEVVEEEEEDEEEVDEEEPDDDEEEEARPPTPPPEPVKAVKKAVKKVTKC